MHLGHFVPFVAMNGDRTSVASGSLVEAPKFERRPCPAETHGAWKTQLREQPADTDEGAADRCAVRAAVELRAQDEDREAGEVERPHHRGLDRRRPVAFSEHAGIPKVTLD